MKRDKLYETWLNIKARCFNLNNPRFSNYGGRGIIVCDEWKNDFLSFKNWALHNGFSNVLTLDRIDVNGNYEPGNCRWISNKQQQNNRRDNIFLTYNSKTQTLAEWSEEIGIPYKTLQGRLNKGMSIEMALTTPIKPKIRDLKGKKFGRLLVVSLAYTNPKAYWNCVCDCGSKKIVKGDSLVSGMTKSCGCIQKEMARERMSKLKKDAIKNLK